MFGNHTCVRTKTGEKLYLSAKRDRVTGYGKVVKIRLDMTLDFEKFELELETTRAIFPRMGIKQFINRTEGINFRTSEGLLFSDLKEAPATTCQRNSLMSQGLVTYFQTQRDKNHKRCLRLCGGSKNNEDMETENCEGLAHIFQDMLTNIYVDEMFLGASSTQHAKDLMKYIDLELGKYNFKVKGWSNSLKVITEDDPLTDEFGYVTEKLSASSSARQQLYTTQLE